MRIYSGPLFLRRDLQQTVRRIEIRRGRRQTLSRLERQRGIRAAIVCGEHPSGRQVSGSEG